jgi:hypothetical protein
VPGNCPISGREISGTLSRFIIVIHFNFSTSISFNFLSGMLFFFERSQKKMKSIFAGVVFLIFILTPSVHATEERYNIPIGDSPSWGPENAPVTFIEFLDYQ